MDPTSGRCKVCGSPASFHVHEDETGDTESYCSRHVPPAVQNFLVSEGASSIKSAAEQLLDYVTRHGQLPPAEIAQRDPFAGVLMGESLHVVAHYLEQLIRFVEQQQRMPTTRELRTFFESLKRKRDFGNEE